MVIIPYSTDAPIYHYPIVTGALIATNVGLFVGVELEYLGTTDDWLLRFGQGLHPVQWLACNFMHLGIAHLFGNMMFLWVFGLITEGKLGWWKFLGCYLGIGVVFAAIEQTLLLSYDGPVTGAAGASAAIFGLIGMALIWAPKNEVHCYFGYWMYSIRLGTFDVSVSAFAGIFFGLNILFLVAHQQLASSEAAHLLGGVCGLALGAVLLVTGRVDCEGWDLFSIWRGETHESRTQQAAEMFDARREEDRQRKLEQAPRLIVFLIEQGNFRKAYETYINTEATCGPVTLDSRNHLVLVKYLLKIRNQAAAITLLEQLVERDPRQKRARLLLAELLLKHQQRPTKAMLLLADETINYPPELESVRQQLLTRARQMQEEGVLELRE